MRKRVFLVAVALVLIAGMGVPAYGWNSFGHMEVAYVAYQNLTPAAKARVNDLLQKNPDYQNWLMMIPADASADDTKMMVFMIAATWPDGIRSEYQYSDDGTNTGNTPDGASSSQNTGYRDLLHHKYFHFVDTALPADGSQPPSPNAQERIALFRGVLASTTSDDLLKSYDLAWVLHLVGDVHQPLHCVTRFSGTPPKSDNGGNAVKVKCTGCPKELHAFWDDLLGTGPTPEASISAVIKAGKKLAAADPTLAAKSDEKVWIAESVSEAQDTVYQLPVGDGLGPFTLTSAYKSTAKTLAMKKIALAGARLANLINNELK